MNSSTENVNSQTSTQKEQTSEKNPESSKLLKMFVVLLGIVVLVLLQMTFRLSSLSNELKTKDGSSDLKSEDTTTLLPKALKNSNLIAKEHFDYQKEPTYYGIEKIAASPDQQKFMLFYSKTFQLDSGSIYDVSTNSMIFIPALIAEDVFWSRDSRFVAFLTKHADADCTSGIVVYDTSDKTLKEFGKKVVEESDDIERLCFKEPRWIDNAQIHSSYSILEGCPYCESVSTGEVVIHVESNEADNFQQLD